MELRAAWFFQSHSPNGARPRAGAGFAFAQDRGVTVTPARGPCSALFLLYPSSAHPTGVMQAPRPAFVQLSGCPPFGTRPPTLLPGCHVVRAVGGTPVGGPVQGQRP